MKGLRFPWILKISSFLRFSKSSTDPPCSSEAKPRLCPNRVCFRYSRSHSTPNQVPGPAFIADGHIKDDSRDIALVFVPGFERGTGNFVLRGIRSVDHFGQGTPAFIKSGFRACCLRSCRKASNYANPNREWNYWRSRHGSWARYVPSPRVRRWLNFRNAHPRIEKNEIAGFSGSSSVIRRCFLAES